MAHIKMIHFCTLPAILVQMFHGGSQPSPWPCFLVFSFHSTQKLFTFRGYENGPRFVFPWQHCECNQFLVLLAIVSCLPRMFSLSTRRSPCPWAEARLVSGPGGVHLGGAGRPRERSRGRGRRRPGGGAGDGRENPRLCPHLNKLDDYSCI